MRPKSVYIIGGAGSGKSTLMGHLLNDTLGWSMGPLEDLHAKRNKKYLVTLRAQQLYRHGVHKGVYLGLMRDELPGTDGLDRASSMTGVEWLQQAELPPAILGEGTTLSTRPFLEELHRQTDLLLVRLTAPEEVHQERLSSRNRQMKIEYTAGTITRAKNVAAYMAGLGATVDTFDTTVWSPGQISAWIEFHLTS